MPTTLPRVNVTFDSKTHQVLSLLARGKHESLGGLIAEMVQAQLELMEDLALADLADKRLASFTRDDALTTENLLRWNKARKHR